VRPIDKPNEHDNQVNAFLESKGIQAEATFVSKKQGINYLKYQTNWRVRFFRPGANRDFTVEYSAGYGLLLPESGKPKYGDNKASSWNKVREFCETGSYRGQLVRSPQPAAVLSCVLLDMSVLDSDGFEDWCGDTGYDSDSILANGIYRTCIEQSLKARSFFGEECLTTLRELLADY
jgi:hypothetical protein